MFALIGVVVSLVMAGAGVATQVSANQMAEQAGAKTVADKASQNKADITNRYATYLSTIDAINEQQAVLDQQAITRHVNTQKTISISLYLTAALLLLLTFIVLLKISPTK